MNWIRRLVVFSQCLLFLSAFTSFSGIAQTSDSLFAIHPQAKSYCRDMTINKRILIGHYVNGGFSAAIDEDLSTYDAQCEQIISQLITNEDEIVLRASPTVFDIYQSDLPPNQRSFDYSFICAANRVTSLTLSAASDWSVLECLQNKKQLTSLFITDFESIALDVKYLTSLPNLQFLSLADGRLVGDSPWPTMQSLTSLSLNKVNFPPKQFKQIGRLTQLESLRLERIKAVNIADLNRLNKLTTLELVYLSKGALSLTGLEQMTQLTSLNLQGSHVNNEVYSAVAQLPNLTRLNLADNQDISQVSSLNQLPQLNQLNISNTEVSDISPLATHPSLFDHDYDIGYSVNYSKTKVTDLTKFYQQGGKNSESAHLLRCSPTSKAEYETGKQCNEEQRQKCKPADIGFFDNYIKAPLCVWWHGE